MPSSDTRQAPDQHGPHDDARANCTSSLTSTTTLRGEIVARCGANPVVTALDGSRYELLATRTHKSKRGTSYTVTLLRNLTLPKVDMLPMYNPHDTTPPVTHPTQGCVTEKATKPSIGAGSSHGVICRNGHPTDELTPSLNDRPLDAGAPTERGTSQAPLLVGFDAEWVDIGKQRRSVLSQQYTVRAADGSLVTAVYEFPIHRRGRTRYRLSSMLKALFDDLAAVGINVNLYSDRRESTVPGGASGTKKPGKACTKKPEKKRAQRAPTLTVVLIAHYGIVDFTTYYDSKELLRRVDSARGTVVTTARPLVVRVTDQWRNRSRKIVLHVRDTMMLAAAGSQLATLGERLGVPKLNLPEGHEKGAMDRLQAERHQDFLCYGARDAEIALLHVEKLINSTAGIVPISLGSQAATILRQAICQEHAWTTEQFDLHFRGLRKVTEKVADAESGEVRVRNYLTARTEAVLLLDVATRCYYGGRSECFLFGIHHAPEGRSWHDYDLASAYPTAMVLVPDPDYSQPPSVLTGRLGRGILGPTSWAFGYVRFRFPADVFYPCLPVKDDAGRGLVFPREGATWASAPELWLALELGAQIELVMPMYVQPTKNRFGLATGVKRLVDLRLQARQQFGKGSPEELAAKERSNSSYGKLAQGLAGTRVYSTRNNQTDLVPPSSITSAPHAALTTGLVRMVVSAAMNELHALGYLIASITTDGFLTDAPQDVVAHLTLGGFTPDVERSRLLLAGDTTIWEEKHACRTLVMLATRTGFGLEPVGDHKLPAAGGSYKPNPAMKQRFSELGRKQYEQRHGPVDPGDLPADSVLEGWYLMGRPEALAELAMKREGRICVELHALPSGRDYVRADADGVGRRIHRQIRWEFDYKRQPLPATIHVERVTIDGQHYEHVSYATSPWATFDDWLDARGAMDLAREGSVKTEQDAHDVVARIGRALAGTARSTYIRGGAHRAAAIATLRALRSGQISCGWLDGTTGLEVCRRVGKAFGVELTTSDWKNAGRASRTAIDFALLEHFAPTLETISICPVDEAALSTDDAAP